MIKIGVVNIDTSHPKAWSEYLSKSDRARYSAIYNDGFRQDDEVEGFMKTANIEKRYSTIEELADSTDIGFVQSCNWDDHIKQAMPFIKKGKPVFLDKPMVGNLKDCKKVEMLVKEGAVILGCSSVRYSEEIIDFLKIPIEERGEVMNIFGTAGVDEFNYGIHIVEAIGGLLGTGAKSVRFLGRSKKQGKTCESFFIEFESGTTAAYNTFFGTWQPFEIVIMTTKGTYQIRIKTTKIYGALLDRICDYMETGKNDLADIADITESIRIMIAAKISRENNGKAIKLAEIPEEDPGYDGKLFEVGYAKAAKKIYV